MRFNWPWKKWKKSPSHGVLLNVFFADFKWRRWWRRVSYNSKSRVPILPHPAILLLTTHLHSWTKFTGKTPLVPLCRLTNCGILQRKPFASKKVLHDVLDANDSCFLAKEISNTNSASFSRTTKVAHLARSNYTLFWEAISHCYCIDQLFSSDSLCVIQIYCMLLKQMLVRNTCKCLLRGEGMDLKGIINFLQWQQQQAAV